LRGENVKYISSSRLFGGAPVDKDFTPGKEPKLRQMHPRVEEGPF